MSGKKEKIVTISITLSNGTEDEMRDVAGRIREIAAREAAKAKLRIGFMTEDEEA